MKHLLSLLFVTLLVTPAAAQDTEYIRALERAQQQRPATLAATARIAPTVEPGPALVVPVQVLGINGSPAANAVVFAYQTDAKGLYDKPENGPHSWRLRGWGRTDTEGRVTFETIRPGSYPNSNNPPHIHFTVFLASGERYHAGELQLSMNPAPGTPTPERSPITLRLEARQKF
jgi:protocatechuate 3,4-dioxygenase beta subunit